MVKKGESSTTAARLCFTRKVPEFALGTFFLSDLRRESKPNQLIGSSWAYWAFCRR